MNWSVFEKEHPYLGCLWLGVFPSLGAFMSLYLICDIIRFLWVLIF